MTPRTQRNLQAAMHHEAFAAAKYKRFAAVARANANETLGDLFEDVADNNRICHFAKEFQLAGLVSDDPSNLQEVIRDKMSQIAAYGNFGDAAEEDGDSKAASLFKSLLADDTRRLGELEQRMNLLGLPKRH